MNQKILVQPNAHMSSEIVFPKTPQNVQLETIEEKTAKSAKHPLEKKSSVSEALIVTLLLGFSISLLSVLCTITDIGSPLAFLLGLVNVTVKLEGPALFGATGAAFLGIGLLVGAAVMRSPRMIDSACADGAYQKISDSVSKKHVENKSVMHCDSVTVMREDFGVLFKAQPQTIVASVNLGQMENNLSEKVLK